MTYIWIFENEYGYHEYFASSVGAYTYCRQYVKDDICDGEDISIDELDEDTRKSLQATLNELEEEYSRNRNSFGAYGMCWVERQEVQP